jgi:CheY-like chemotaxis protein
MVLFADLVTSGDVTDEQRKLYAENLRRQSHRLTDLINNTLSLQRFEAGNGDLELAPVDVGSLIDRAVRAAGEDERRPISVRRHASLPLVWADPEAILDVLANFLSNARTFSPGGGAIVIESRAIGKMVEISIRDHGIGIEADTLPKLFRKFYRAPNDVRRRGPGAGLGLAINHRIVEAHRGQVTASSKGPGRGARFQFTLPVAQEIPRSGFVLIVEGDAASAKLLKAAFASVGLDSIRAADAETALHVLAEATPEAIALDVWLPGLQGVDFLSRMRASFGLKVPVVVLTAKALPAAPQSALEAAGVMAVLPMEAGAPQAAAGLISEALNRSLVSS